MTKYEIDAINELNIFKKEMTKRDSIVYKITKKVQNKTNSFIPEKVHMVITEGVKNMIKIVLFTSKYVTVKPPKLANLEERENLAYEKLNLYRKTATISGAGTGLGGLMLGLADFPILLTIKINFLFNLANIYGIDAREYKERLYILYIFQLAFSEGYERRKTYNKIINWSSYSEKLPDNINDFNWREFQQEYRDYIDFSKMLQIIPGIGAPIGAYANYKLMNKLAYVAINCFRMRYFSLN
ncbi:EcsC family protein [Clostridium botulinum]|uniref:EcsC family protein n=1 Tax=Clostridium botulinum TaxID=1491 RepID=UPI0005F93DE3|nr:EcsC family protein [Clostridium botulinum]MBD5587208.1 EcsC family protein [Clostridium botulinum]MBO0572285.1 EcsC family protein [Clostridium botulinum]MBO0581726.1 EcsC family protein [Clostridium botulinum]NFJ62137.1 EcsC family protein [Clostridium botulinum]NFJ69076.1 EcsC family protein [Clostridium botulinum]